MNTISTLIVWPSVLAWTFFSCLGICSADPVAARFKQGSGHIFLVLHGEDGKTLAVGEATERVAGVIVTSRLTFHFRDGSLDDDTTVFEQRSDFRLLSDHHIQKGPSFPHPLDIRIDIKAAQVTMHDPVTGKDTIEHMDLPIDLANGMIPQLLQNLAGRTETTTVSYVAATAGSKPRLVKFTISPAGQEPFFVAPTRHEAQKFEIQVELGGVAAIVAPILGKQPRKNYAWVLGGQVPAFLKMQAQLYEDGPLWTIQQASPVWPAATNADQHVIEAKD